MWHNIIGIFPGRTSEQAGGDKAGVQVRFTMEDVDRLSNCVPGIEHISPGFKGCDGAERSAHLHLDSERRTPVFQDIWSSIWNRAASSTGPRTSSAPCVRHRVGSKDEALLRRMGAGRDDPAERRDVTIIGVLKPEDAGRRQQQSQSPNLRSVHHHERHQGHEVP